MTIEKRLFWTLIFTALILAPAVFAAAPTASNITITPTSVTNDEVVTMRGTCTDADGAANLRGCQFTDGIGGANVFPVGTLTAVSATKAECFWQGTDFSGFTGDIEYRLACTDNQTTSFGPFNENTTIKRDTLIAGEVSINGNSVTLTNPNFVAVTPHLSRRFLAIFGESGDGRPAQWQHVITSTLPSSPSTLGWYVCEGRAYSCGCAPKASSADPNRSVQWTADAPHNGTHFETLCWQTNTAPRQTANITDQVWNEDAALLNAFDLDSFFSDPDNDNITYAVTGNRNISVTIDSGHRVSFSQPADYFGTEVIFFTARDQYNATVNSNLVRLTVVDLPDDSTAPNVTLSLSDSDGLVSGTLTILVTAFDQFLESVSIYINNVLVQTCDALLSQATCSYLIDTSLFSDGLYTITGYAVDTSGNSATDSESTIFDNTAPTISSDIPQEISYTSDLLVLYNVTDANGINSTNATFNGQSVNSSQNISGLAPGNYTLSIRSRDNAGNSGGSSATVTVVDDVAPVITILSPNTTTYFDTQSVTFLFSAFDEASTIASVNALLDNNTSILTNQTINLSNVSLGNHAFMITATDGTGNSATALVTFVVVQADGDGDGFVLAQDCNDNNNLINPDAAEICDALDNDCNAEIDENLTVQTGTDVGVCEFGIQMCQNGTYVITQEEIAPTGEICDGLDNDCDSAVPEDETDADNDFILMCQDDNCPAAYNPDQLDSDNDDAGNACDFELNLNAEQLWITPEVLNINPGTMTMHTALPYPFNESGITGATLDGAPFERISGFNVHFERTVVEEYLASLGQALDVFFEVRGTLLYNNLTYTFVGNDSISEIQQ